MTSGCFLQKNSKFRPLVCLDENQSYPTSIYFKCKPLFYALCLFGIKKSGELIDIAF
ncbi:hypothetical protein X874_6500 [Mannheimia varigena USDA-ARS-USMARC-1312]|uniref:Uncharacterized protein n=1 Tax=Mannheimia varigena USDA-ARS-USMARC-1296 TaxID=1433287 RepID=W0QA37_9PAST|nr:hypothetical protein X808_6390 [Mannheimia varigena USDA-ARS-USMARC-1296]AHG77286.1 hypothetical protein X874_6500 [Mannheimia varigena USDA-ARS-USMARC-1312]AHG80053.1 hypothetical protein X875_14350 [Mannheimia varigena USDA-ARS-USMARC-1388]